MTKKQRKTPGQVWTATGLDDEQLTELWRRAMAGEIHLSAWGPSTPGLWGAIFFVVLDPVPRFNMSFNQPSRLFPQVTKEKGSM